MGFEAVAAVLVDAFATEGAAAVVGDVALGAAAEGAVGVGVGELAAGAGEAVLVDGAAAGALDAGGYAGVMGASDATGSLGLADAGGMANIGGAEAFNAAGSDALSASINGGMTSAEVGANVGTGAGNVAAGAGGSSLGTYAQLASSVYNQYNAAQLKAAGKAADPFAAYRPGYAKQLQDLMAHPDSVTKLPGYQSGLRQAEQTLTRQSASQGLTGSGTTAAALANLGSTYENQFYNQQVQTLSGLGGSGINNAGLSLGAQVAGTNASTADMNSLMKLLPMLTGAGQGGGGGGGGGGSWFDAGSGGSW